MASTSKLRRSTRTAKKLACHYADDHYADDLISSDIDDDYKNAADDDNDSDNSKERPPSKRRRKMPSKKSVDLTSTANSETSQNSKVTSKKDTGKGKKQDVRKASVDMLKHNSPKVIMSQDDLKFSPVILSEDDLIVYAKNRVVVSQDDLEVEPFPDDKYTNNLPQEHLSPTTDNNRSVLSNGQDISETDLDDDQKSNISEVKPLSCSDDEVDTALINFVKNSRSPTRLYERNCKSSPHRSIDRQNLSQVDDKEAVNISTNGSDSELDSCSESNSQKSQEKPKRKNSLEEIESKEKIELSQKKKRTQSKAKAKPQPTRRRNHRNKNITEKKQSKYPNRNRPAKLSSKERKSSLTQLKPTLEHLEKVIPKRDCRRQSQPRASSLSEQSSSEHDEPKDYTRRSSIGNPTKEMENELEMTEIKTHEPSNCDHSSGTAEEQKENEKKLSEENAELKTTTELESEEDSVLVGDIKIPSDVLELLKCPRPEPFDDKYIGAHTSIANGLQNAVYDSVRIGGRAMGMFLKNQRQWKSTLLNKQQIYVFKRALQVCGISPDKVLPHASYLLNCGSPDEEKLQKSREMLIDELTRCEILGLRLYNIHPGSTCGLISRIESIHRIAESINIAHKATSTVTVVLENMSGQGNTIGGHFSELRSIIDQVYDKSRVGVCIDTCHAFAAGFDIRTKAGFEDLMSALDEIIGLQFLRAFHLNDSKSPLNSHLDRHENIGKGYIGKEGFRHIINDHRLKNIPIILETPPDLSDADEIKMLYQFIQDKHTFSS